MLLWKPQNREAFFCCIADLLETPQVRSLRQIGAHRNSNCYEHSVFVAYVSFLLCRKLHWDYRAAARGGLLHDLFLYDRKDKGCFPGKHLRFHPHAALQNASRLCTLSSKEADIIVKHMWPVTRPLPRYKESYLVSSVDKLCAFLECQLAYRWLCVKQNISVVSPHQKGCFSGV